jgi:hypothetical protein
MLIWHDDLSGQCLCLLKMTMDEIEFLCKPDNVLACTDRENM